MTNNMQQQVSTNHPPTKTPKNAGTTLQRWELLYADAKAREARRPERCSQEKNIRAERGQGVVEGAKNKPTSKANANSSRGRRISLLSPRKTKNFNMTCNMASSSYLELEQKLRQEASENLQSRLYQLSSKYAERMAGLQRLCAAITFPLEMADESIRHWTGEVFPSLPIAETIRLNLKSRMAIMQSLAKIEAEAQSVIDSHRREVKRRNLGAASRRTRGDPNFEECWNWGNYFSNTPTSDMKKSVWYRCAVALSKSSDKRLASRRVDGKRELSNMAPQASTTKSRGNCSRQTIPRDVPPPGVSARTPFANCSPRRMIVRRVPPVAAPLGGPLIQDAVNRGALPNNRGALPNSVFAVDAQQQRDGMRRAISRAALERQNIAAIGEAPPVAQRTTASCTHLQTPSFPEAWHTAALAVGGQMGSLRDHHGSFLSRSQQQLVLSQTSNRTFSKGSDLSAVTEKMTAPIATVANNVAACGALPQRPHYHHHEERGCPPTPLFPPTPLRAARLLPTAEAKPAPATVVRTQSGDESEVMKGHDLNIQTEKIVGHDFETPDEPPIPKEGASHQNRCFYRRSGSHTRKKCLEEENNTSLLWRMASAVLSATGPKKPRRFC